MAPESNRIATMAFDPRIRASSIMRAIASLRLCARQLGELGDLAAAERPQCRHASGADVASANRQSEDLALDRDVS